jgi:NAD(P)-dependent dehydrogenase (short-subunit alcohol dehydrogenase family)
MQDLDLTEWHKTFNANVFGPMYLTKLISQKMASEKIQGCITFVTSIHEFVPGGWVCYSSTKAALGMIVKELSLDLASHGIRVNGIAPGWVSETEKGNPFGFRWAALHKSSINPCYIGRAAVYLASDYFSRFTTGTTLKIDAGLSLYHFRSPSDPMPK